MQSYPREFLIWAFGEDEIQITVETFEKTLKKLYEIYTDLDNGTARKNYIMEKMNNELFKLIADKESRNS